MNPYQLIELETVDSTNRFLKDYCADHLPKEPVFCITELQTDGYGQQKRSWLSNDQSAVFSLAYPIEKNTIVEGLVSLNIAAQVHRVLTELQETELFLKWPNDLVAEQGKVAGILIEQVMQKDYRALIIGVGINRSHIEGLETSVGTGAFDLKDFLDQFYNRLQTQGVTAFDRDKLLSYWRENDFFTEGEEVRVILDDYQNSQQWRAGTYLGVDSDGRAEISLQDDELKQSIQSLKLVSGQNSIRTKI